MDFLAQSQPEFQALTKILVMIGSLVLAFIFSIGIYKRSRGALSFLSFLLLVFGVGLIIKGASENSFLSDGKGNYYGMMIIAGGIVIHAAIQLILGLKNSKDSEQNPSNQDDP